jgi:response regulator NasT
LNIVSDKTPLTSAIAAINPDIVLIDLDNPSRDVLKELTLATAPLERPVALFVDQRERTCPNRCSRPACLPMSSTVCAPTG